MEYSKSRKYTKRLSVAELRDIFDSAIKWKHEDTDDSKEWQSDQSNFSFFEIFDNEECKCNLPIPDTITVQDGNYHSWYFTNKDGLIYRKRSERLNLNEIFSNFINGYRKDLDLEKLLKVARSGKLEEEYEFSQCDPIAYIRFNRRESEFTNPLDFFKMLTDNEGIRMIQSYIICGKNPLVEDKQYRFRKKKSLYDITSQYIKKKAMPACITVYKNFSTIGSHSSTNLQIKPVQSKANQFNMQIEILTKNFVQFYEKFRKVLVKSAKCKFLQDRDKQIYFTGCDEMYFICIKPKLSKAVPEYHQHRGFKTGVSNIFDITQQYLFKQLVTDKKETTINPNKKFICNGDFCDIVLPENSQFITHHNKKKLLENLKKIPQKNKFDWFNNPPQIPIAMIKKARDNKKVVAEILIDSEATTQMKNFTLLTHQQKIDEMMYTMKNHRLILNVNNIYQPVKICMTCYSIYTLVSKIINKYSVPESKNNTKWIHTERLLSPLEEAIETVQSKRQKQQEKKKLERIKRHFMSMPSSPMSGTGKEQVLNTSMHTERTKTAESGIQRPKLLPPPPPPVHRIITRIQKSDISSIGGRLRTFEYEIKFNKKKKKSSSKKGMNTFLSAYNRRNYDMAHERVNQGSSKVIFTKLQMGLPSQTYNRMLGAENNVTTDVIKAEDDPDLRKKENPQKPGKKIKKQEEEIEEMVNMFEPQIELEEKYIKEHKCSSDSWLLDLRRDRIIIHKGFRYCSSLKGKHLLPFKPNSGLPSRTVSEMVINPEEQIDPFNKFVAQRRVKRRKGLIHATFAMGIYGIVSNILQKLQLGSRGGGIFDKKMEQISSVFHHSNLEHLKQLPSYRITTPKISCCGYTASHIPNNPHEIDTEMYCKQNNFPYELLKYCGVFLINENTSLLYTIIQATEDEQSKYERARKKSKQIQSMTTLPISQMKIEKVRAISALDSNPPLHSKSHVDPEERFSTLIVFNDFFDNFIEQIEVYKSIAKDNQGIRILLMNLPGQAYTKYSPEVVLNNEFYHRCVNLLLYYLEEIDLINISTQSVGLLGFGNGGNTALYWAINAYSTCLNLRGILLFNSFSYIDDVLKDSLFKAIQSLISCPKDLPEFANYFFANLTESVSNIALYDKRVKFTHKSNPMTVNDRIKIFKGCLNHLNLSGKLSALHLPIIAVHSKNNCLVHIKHADSIIESIPDEDKPKNLSLDEVMEMGYLRHLILIQGGHNIFQENVNSMKEIVTHFCGSKQYTSS